MRSILICPAERPVSRWLARTLPLSNVPLLGWSLLEYWLSHLSASGIREVLVVASDRPEQVRALVGNGARWGLQAEVVSSLTEPVPEEAPLAVRTPETGSGDLAGAITLEDFPRLPGYPLFTSSQDWFRALMAWMPHAIPPDRVGVSELQTGVRVSLRARLSPRANLIGEGVYVGPGACIGPEVVLERGACVEARARVSHSVIGPATFVGQYVALRNSLASGNLLVDWSTQTETTVTDAFILCSLQRPQPARKGAHWLKSLAKRRSSPNRSESLDWGAFSAPPNRLAD